MWWIRNQKLRVVKKYTRPYLDGVLYTWKHYITLMEYVQKLKSGHIIWNPYRHNWDVIKNITYNWATIQHGKFIDDEWVEGRICGQYIDEFYIDLESGYRLYDIDQWHWLRLPTFSSKEDENLWFEKLLQFNKQIGLYGYDPGPFIKEPMRSLMTIDKEAWLSQTKNDE